MHILTWWWVLAQVSLEAEVEDITNELLSARLFTIMEALLADVTSNKTIKSEVKLEFGRQRRRCLFLEALLPDTLTVVLTFLARNSCGKLACCSCVLRGACAAAMTKHAALHAAELQARIAKFANKIVQYGLVGCGVAYPIDKGTIVEGRCAAFSNITGYLFIEAGGEPKRQLQCRGTGSVWREMCICLVEKRRAHVLCPFCEKPARAVPTYRFTGTFTCGIVREDVLQSRSMRKRNAPSLFSGCP